MLQKHLLQDTCDFLRSRVNNMVVKKICKCLNWIPHWIQGNHHGGELVCLSTSEAFPKILLIYKNEDVCQLCWQYCLELLRGWRLHNFSREYISVFVNHHCRKKEFSLYWDVIPCFSICTHCLLSYLQVLLKRVCLPFLHCLMSAIYTHSSIYIHW